MGGGNPEMNPRLRLSIEKARGVNMPSDNVKRAIQKGTGELPGTSYEEIMYEGFGPAGVALMIEVMTDNKNRTVPELRQIMGKQGGTIAETGSVAWMFEKKGYILVDKKVSDEDTLMNLALESGAEDVKNEPEEENFEIITAPADFVMVKEYLEKEKVDFNLAEVTYIPRNYIRLEARDAVKMLKLMDALEEHDDIQNVYANFDIPDDLATNAHE